MVTKADTISVLDPATGCEVANVASWTATAALAACDVAATGQRRWAAAPPRARAEALTAAFVLMQSRRSSLAEMIVAEHGKPLADALAEVDYAAEFVRWNAEEAVRIDGRSATAPGGSRIIVRHPPIGVVAVITPWNFPLAMIARKVAPALAAGNAVVVKPAAQTPLSALAFRDVLVDAGVPADVVHVHPTSNPGAWLEAVTGHDAVRMVTFTGSTAVGRSVLECAARRVLRAAVELGGNAPFIVFADADLDAAVSGALIAKMRHSAQTCTAANRFFVERPIATEFATRLATEMGAMRVGAGSSDDVQCGPLIDDVAVRRVDALVADAVGRGARVLTGGRPCGGAGSFYPPTVLVDVAAGSAVLTDEIFGPVAPVVAFDDEDEVVAAANESEAGLAGYVYSGDLRRALAVAERLECGMVGINCGVVSEVAAPFGGMKQSGLGREGGPDGILEFCETQYLAVDW